MQTGEATELMELKESTNSRDVPNSLKGKELHIKIPKYHEFIFIYKDTIFCYITKV